MNENVVKGAILVAIGLLAAMTGKKLAERGFERIKQKNIDYDILVDMNTEGILN